MGDGKIPVTAAYTTQEAKPVRPYEAIALIPKKVNEKTAALDAAKESENEVAIAAAQAATDAAVALSKQVAPLINALKKQLVALTNQVLKIQKKIRA